MTFKARYIRNHNTVAIDANGTKVSLSLDDIDQIFSVLMEANKAPQLEAPSGVHYPTGINAVPLDGALHLYMQFPDGSEGQFAFEAPGKSQEQVSLASQAIRSGFEQLFAVH